MREMGEREKAVRMLKEPGVADGLKGWSHGLKGDVEPWADG